jgi:23S rRNA (guanosine2251-2'-O)-methyltransferase
MNHSAPLNNLAIKTSCGASETVPYVKVQNIARGIETVQELGYQVIGMDAEANSDLFSCDLKSSTAFVLGDEGTGLKNKTREFCDYLTKLPMSGTVESLNVSVACAISLFEDFRQKYKTN